MFIRTLKLQNLRSHAETSLKLDRLNVVRGSHGAGKTSLQYAIELALTNRCDLTDARGAGSNILIRQGEKQMAIELDLLINGAHCLIRSDRTATTGNWTVGMATGKRAIEVVEKNISAIPVLSAVLNAHRFLQMTPTEQRDLLARALASDPVKLDRDPLLEQVYGDGFVREAGDIDRLHKHFYDLRAELNREIKALGNCTKPELPEDMPSAETVKKQIAELQAQQYEKLKTRSGIGEKYQADKTRYEAAQAQKTRYDKDFLSNKDLANFQKISKNASEARKLEKKIDDARTSILLLREQISLATGKLEFQQESCQSCGQALPDAAQTRRDLQATIDEQTGKLKEFEQTFSDLQLKRSELGDPEHAIEKIDAHQVACKACLAADEVLKNGEPARPDVAALDTEISELEKRVARGQEVLAKVLEYEAQLKVYNDRVERKEQYAKKVLDYERMVEYFGPKSPLRGKLIAGKAEQFRTRINEILERFGFEFDFELEGEPFVLKVLRIDEYGGPIGSRLELRALSESEQYRFSIAFSIAIAEATGVRLVVFDRADVLLEGARSQLMAALLEEIHSERLDQAFILSAGEPRENYPEIEHVQFIQLTNDNGETTVEEIASYATGD